MLCVGIVVTFVYNSSSLPSNDSPEQLLTIISTHGKSLKKLSLSDLTMNSSALDNLKPCLERLVHFSIRETAEHHRALEPSSLEMIADSCSRKLKSIHIQKKVMEVWERPVLDSLEDFFDKRGRDLEKVEICVWSAIYDEVYTEWLFLDKCPNIRELNDVKLEEMLEQYDYDVSKLKLKSLSMIVYPCDLCYFLKDKRYSSLNKLKLR